MSTLEFGLRTAIDAGLIIAWRGKFGVTEFAGRVARDGAKMALRHDASHLPTGSGGKHLAQA